MRRNLADGSAVLYPEARLIAAQLDQSVLEGVSTHQGAPTRGFITTLFPKQLATVSNAKGVGGFFYSQL